MDAFLALVAKYFILSYLCETAGDLAGRLAGRLKSQPGTVALLASSGFGVALAWTARLNLLSDLGFAGDGTPLGFILTGILIGQGTRYLKNWFGRLIKRD